jgi:hypothetical protein
MVERPTESFAISDDETRELWLEYARGRFEDSKSRVSDRRSWARQLVTWIGVVIALELNLVPKLSERLYGPGADPAWWTRVIVLLGMIVSAQLVLLAVAASAGYLTVNTIAPEKPSQLIKHLRDAPPPKAQEMIAAYFAKSYNHYDDLAEQLGRRLTHSTWGMIITLCLFSIVVAAAFWFTHI